MALPARGGVGVWVVVCAALTILAAPWGLGLPGLAFIFKPATTLLLILYASRRGSRHAGRAPLGADRPGLLAGR